MSASKLLSKIYFAFAGDWHGDSYWAESVIRELANRGIKRLYQLGDFGLMPGAEGQIYLLRVAKALRENNMTLYVVLGNHDDYDQVATMKSDKDDWLKMADPAYASIYFAPRGHTWQESGLNFAALGGANSVDRLVRVEGVSWWPGEEITEKDCQTLIANVEERGWDRVDILLTHEAPAGITMQSMFQNSSPWWLTEEVLFDSHTQRVRLRNVVDVIMPRIVTHGHWHYRSRNIIEGVNLKSEDYTSVVLGLANEGSGANIWLPRFEELSELVSY